MKEEPFTIRAYGKGELAMIYFPMLAPESAANKFRTWLKLNPRLKHLVSRRSNDYTPKQVKLIVDELGEP